MELKDGYVGLNGFEYRVWHAQNPIHGIERYGTDTLATLRCPMNPIHGTERGA